MSLKEVMKSKWALWFWVTRTQRKSSLCSRPGTTACSSTGAQMLFVTQRTRVCKEALTGLGVWQSLVISCLGLQALSEPEKPPRCGSSNSDAENLVKDMKCVWSGSSGSWGTCLCDLGFTSTHCHCLYLAVGKDGLFAYQEVRDCGSLAHSYNPRTKHKAWPAVGTW